LQRWTQKRPVLVAVLMAAYSAQSLLITASKQSDGFGYDATAAVLLAEVAKLIFTVLMLSPEARSAVRPTASCLLFAVPAVLYVVQNRLVFEALRRLAPPEYQLLNNMKLFTTSLVFRVTMKRRLTLLQWLALVLLAVGMAVATREPPSAAGGRDAASAVDGAGDDGRGMWTGIGYMTMVSWCSAFAGVSNEWLIKRSPNALEANLWLYLFGLIPCCWQLSMTPDAWGRLLRLEGFSLLTWMVVLCNAVLGQTIAFLLRYADSIVKLHAVCAAMGFTTVMSVCFLGFEVRFNMVAGYLTTFVSMCLFYVPPQVLLAADSDVLASVCNGKRIEDGGEKSH